MPLATFNYLELVICILEFPLLCSGVVEEYFVRVEVGLARAGGVCRRKNVGMSSKKAGENPAHLKSKVSWAMVVNPGLVGPNRLSERIVRDG